MRIYPGFIFAILSTAACAASAPGKLPDSGPDAGEDGGDAGMDAGLANPYCADAGYPTASFVPDSSGLYRGDIAPDFALPLYDGGTWQFSTEFTGCDSYVFLTEAQTVSSIDPTPLVSQTDWGNLIAQSPPNTHYFFVSINPTTTAADQIDATVAGRIASALAGLPADQAAIWQSRLHVVAGNAQRLGEPLGPIATGWGALGFAIDRSQRYRGVGFLSDVRRFDQKTQNDAGWGFLGNLAYAANEPIYMNAQAVTQARLDAENATVVTLLDGGVVAQYVDMDGTLPSASELQAFDTLEVEVVQHCPDPTDLEFNSCGAWDYIASLGVDDPSMPSDDAGYSYLELARFITSYHRETHWVVDATPMLARLAGGGTRHFQWSFAPSWNTQPTATVVNLRFSNQGKGYRPEALLPLWTDPGATFNDTYDANHPPITVDIPSDATRVELWMIVTGHGSDAYQCCEFCNHEHLFTVNDGGPLLVDFQEAGTADQCIPEESKGMTPNQGGTWWFGRGGWCPGEQVDPHVIDVTSLVQPGQPATVATQGKLGSGAPPANGGGDVDLQSMLVAYH